MKSIILLGLVVYLVSSLTSVSSVVLDVPGYGSLLGSQEKSAFTDRPYYAFQSLYYAEKPTNLTRFLPPVPKAPYPDDVLVDATRDNGGCNQGGGDLGDEDCLSLDVFTPKLPLGDGSDTLLPVMFWIHGGGFSLGQAVEYVPTRYMEHDIVVVVIQYRLGPLGFLCYDTDDVPGNAGIFDQIEALRWVNKHIAAFGGDPNKITIAGESAGSASVSILLLAPQARGLFHQAIGESGSVLAEWAIDSGDRGKIASIRVAEIAGCPTSPYSDMLYCVRNIEPEVLTAAYNSYMVEDMKNGNLGFSSSNPVIQKAGAQRIIEVPPKELFDSGNYANVPAMFGSNKQEGTLVLGLLYTGYLVPNNLVENSTYLANDVVPDILKALHIDDPDGSLAAALTEQYLGDAEMGNFASMTPGLTDLCGVLFLKAATYDVAIYNSGRNPKTFYYAFNFEGRNSLFTYFFVRSDPPIPHGVCHADELIYLWSYPFPSIPPGLNATEEILSKKMTQVWTNFVIHGHPTPVGVGLLEGIPKYEPLDRVGQFYTDIDLNWEVKVDYTQTYTVTVDELNASSGHLRKVPDVHGRFNRQKPLKSMYLPKNA